MFKIMKKENLKEIQEFPEFEGKKKKKKKKIYDNTFTCSNGDDSVLV